ncbi:helix-turn-helix domain-containing protein [Nocardioides dilutus]
MSNTKAGIHRPLPEPVAAALAGALRGHRTSRGVTQEDLATRAGVSVQMVRRLEAGTANPTLGTLHAVTIALDITWTDLLLEIER